MSTFYIVVFIIVAFCTGLIVGFAFGDSDFNSHRSDELTSTILSLAIENDKLKKQIEHIRGCFIAKQPNGLYCIFSTKLDCPTHYNMTREDYIEYKKSVAENEASYALDCLGERFNQFHLIERFYRPGNMTKKEFKKILKEMSEECTDGYKCPNIRGDKNGK